MYWYWALIIAVFIHENVFFPPLREWLENSVQILKIKNFRFSSTFKLDRAVEHTCAMYIINMIVLWPVKPFNVCLLYFVKELE